MIHNTYVNFPSWWGKIVVLHRMIPSILMSKDEVIKFSFGYATENKHIQGF